MDFLKEFFQFLIHRKKLWMMPIFILMLMLGGLIVFTKGSALAPFIYTLF